ncbi:MAG TPA: hypothetical protein VK358_05605, partial [Longimicrobium sp.]|nr:hypothetical protein [Longimicrobium sp.]
ERRMRAMALGAKGKATDLARLSDRSELDQADRHELDDAVLELLGVRTRAERKGWLTRLYGYLEEMFEQTRAKEEKAIGNKNRTRRRGAVRPADVAAQVWEQLETNHSALLRRYDPDVIDRKQPYDTYDVPREGEPQEHSDLFHPHCVLFSRSGRNVGAVEVRSKAQASLLALLARSGIRGLVRVPYDADESQRIKRRYQELLTAREERVRALIAERANDPELQEKVMDLISARLTNPR